MESLYPPTWVVHRPPVQHLAILQGAPVDEWHTEPDITQDQLFHQLTTLVKGTSQACSYRSQESYFRHSQLFKETMQSYENEQGFLYHDRPVHLDSDIAGLIMATVAHLQWELREAKDA